MGDLRITTVRHGPEKCRSLLKRFLHGGQHTSPYVPRGLIPDVVSLVIREEVKPNSGRNMYSKALELMRFYERGDVVDHLKLALNRREQNFVDLMRSTFAVRAAGDLGNEKQRTEAAAYHDSAVVPHAEADRMYEEIADTLVVLAPAGSSEAFKGRMQREVKRREPLQDQSEKDMLAYDTVLEVLEQVIPGAEATIADKKKLIALPPGDRAKDLVDIYLGLKDPSDDSMRVWAARQIRFDVAVVSFDLHKPRFVEAIDSLPERAKKEEWDQVECDLLLMRSMHAIMYFMSAPTLGHLEQYVQAKRRGGIHLNFLCDEDE